MINNNRYVLILAATFATLVSSASAQNLSPYKVGLTFPLTGQLASSTPNQVPGAEIAALEINRAGGINGHPLQILVEDTQGTAEGGIAAMRKLVQVDGVQAIISIYTNIVLAQMPLATQLKVPLLCPCQAPNLMNKSAYSFAHAETLPGMIGLYREHWRKAKIKRLYALVPNNGFGLLFSAETKNLASAIGAEYGETTFNYGSGDYRGMVARVKEFNPDAIMLNVQGGIDDTLIIKQLRESGVDSPVGLSANLYYEPAWRSGIGPYISGLIMAGVDVDPKAGKQFIDDFRIKTGRYPAPGAAEVYDMVQMLATTIRDGGYNGEAIARQLTTIKGVPSVLGGMIAMDPDHYSPVQLSLWVARGGQLQRLKE